MVKSTAVLLTAVLLTASPAASMQDAPFPAGEETPPPAARLNSLQKSLLLPGWGQAAEKHYLEAFLFFSAEVFCWAGFIDQNRRGDRSYEGYRAADNLEDAARFRAETETFDTRRNRFLLAAALVWAANLLDTYWITAGRTKETGGRSLSLRLDCGEGQALSVALSYRY